MLTRARASLQPQAQPQAAMQSADGTVAKRRSTRSSGSFASLHGAAGPAAALPTLSVKDTNLLVDIAAPLPMANFASPFKPAARSTKTRTRSSGLHLTAVLQADPSSSSSSQSSADKENGPSQEEEEELDESDRQWAELNRMDDKPMSGASSQVRGSFTPVKRGRRSHQPAAAPVAIDEEPQAASSLLSDLASTPASHRLRSSARTSLTPNPNQSAAATARRRRSSALHAHNSQQQQQASSLAAVIPVEEEEFNGSVIPGPLDCSHVSDEEDDVVNASLSLSLPPVSFTPSSYARTRRSMARAAGATGAVAPAPTRRSDRRSLHHTQLQLLKQLVQDEQHTQTQMDDQTPHAEHDDCVDQVSSVSAETGEKNEEEESTMAAPLPIHLSEEFAQQCAADTSMENHAEETEQIPLASHDGDNQLQSGGDAVEELDALEQSVASIVAPMDQSPFVFADLQLEPAVEEGQAEAEAEEELAVEAQLEAEEEEEEEEEAEEDNGAQFAQSAEEEVELAADAAALEPHAEDDVVQDEPDMEAVAADEEKQVPIEPVAPVAVTVAPVSVRKTRATGGPLGPVELLAGSSTAAASAAGSLFGFSGMALAFHGVTPPSTPLGAKNIMLPRSSNAKSAKKSAAARRGSAAAHAKVEQQVDKEKEEDTEPAEYCPPVIVAAPSCTPLQITPRSNSRRKSLKARHDDDEEEYQQQQQLLQLQAWGNEEPESAAHTQDQQQAFDAQEAEACQPTPAPLQESIEDAHADAEEVVTNESEVAPVVVAAPAAVASTPARSHLAPVECLLPPTPTPTPTSAADQAAEQQAQAQQKRSKKSLLRAITSRGANDEIPDDILAQLFVRPAPSPVKDANTAVACAAPTSTSDNASVSASASVSANASSSTNARVVVPAPLTPAASPVASPSTVVASVDATTPTPPVDLATLFSSGPQLIAYSPMRSPKQTKAQSRTTTPATNIAASAKKAAVASTTPAASPATPRLRSRLSAGASAVASPQAYSDADADADADELDGCTDLSQSTDAVAVAAVTNASLRRLRPAEIALYGLAFLVVLAALLYLF